MSQPLAASNNSLEVTPVIHSQRITNATITVTIISPEGVTTLPTASMSHVGNGVYRMILSPSATPKKGFGYKAQLGITIGNKVLNPVYYFNVYEG